MKEIYSKLSGIQRELKAPKNLHNNFGNYNYRNAEGILEAVKPMLDGLCLVINDEPVMIGDRYYIKATVTLTDGEESVSAVAYAREDQEKKGMDGCQLTGACSSYARKYALNALLMIDDSKDSDDDYLSPKNPDNKEEPKNHKETKPVNNNRQNNAPATVTPVASVPPVPKDEPKPAQATEAQKYLMKACAELREARGITAKKNNELFKVQKDALVAAGLAPDKPSEQYTLEEAKALVESMYANFTPDGTEIKK